jgi:hypothetical protein
MSPLPSIATEKAGIGEAKATRAIVRNYERLR